MSDGFTLVELMVVVALIALVLTQGIPWLKSTTLNNRRTVQVNDYIANLNLARGLAISGDESDLPGGITPCTGCDVTICKSIDGLVCTTSSSVNWHDGWVVFWDADGDGVVDAVDNDRLIRVQAALEGDSTLKGNLSVVNRISFDPNGFTGNNGTVVWCDSRGFGSEARAIVVSGVGRVRLTTVDDPNITLSSCSP
ncbi:MAG: GspH/FimT family pseudopilin [Gammaproteobacteria bacterium]|nr:GspH/FimT family pseudopilin [Gammaproteobacteria bacterium]